jgi:hypothetical protein
LLELDPGLYRLWNNCGAQVALAVELSTVSVGQLWVLALLAIGRVDQGVGDS